MSRSRFTTRSRYRSIGAGDAIFAQSTGCPDGFHYVPDAVAPGSVRGLGACVPNVQVVPLHLRPTSTASAPAPVTATAPAPALVAACPDVWPWWWLLVAGGLGGALGYYAQKNQKAAKKNAGRIVNAAGGRLVNAASQAAIARLVG